MTLPEYVNKVRAQLRTAPDYDSVIDIVADAQYNLNTSDLSNSDRAQFWKALDQQLRIHLKEQNHSMTNALVTQTQTLIAKLIADLQ